MTALHDVRIIAPGDRYYIARADDGSYWIVDHNWPEKQCGEPELISTFSERSAIEVCKILNSHHAAYEVRKAVKEKGKLIVVQ